MAEYRNAAHLHQAQDDAFAREYPPGAPAPSSGIYRCAICGREEASNRAQPLPPQNHHQHSAGLGGIRWKLLVRTS
jgi:hypothetical protein